MEFKNKLENVKSFFKNASSKDFLKKVSKKKSIPEKDDEEKETLFDWAKMVLCALFLAIFIRSFFCEIFFIPSGSMYPGLVVGDHILVSKYSYGYSRYSFPLSLPLFEGRLLDNDLPARGDKIVFRHPKDNGEKIDYIKRLVGFPGDKIQVVGGRLYINGEVVDRKYVGEFLIVNLPKSEKGEKLLSFKNDFGTFEIVDNKTLIRDGKELKLNEDYNITYWDQDSCSRLCGVAKYKKYLETMPNGHQHYIVENSDSDFMDNTEVFNVPDGHYFFMGDNRDNSQDSRFLEKVGYVPAENLIGRAELVLYSYSGAASVLQPWRWHKSLFFGRFFKKLDIVD
ncbi:MAG: signal peptidase I [Alphaproteobacteria bacterium]|jgi:signal peptidase I|nr:signal peptidase I [Alphaproteobacteria bacterium]